MKKPWLASLICLSALSAGPLFAAPSEALIADYNLAAQGDADKVTQVYQQLTAQIEAQGTDALSLVYLGSTQTLMGRDAWMPWNKMKYTEQGLATISKGLDLLASQPIALEKQARIQGLPESLLARSIAASTFTSLPDMFNHFERGYDLFLDLLHEPSFTQQPIEATSWVYLYAVKAALKAGDKAQGEAWVEHLQRLYPQHTVVAQAQALLRDAA
ncbi:hypothetical protein [Vibrio sinaloensis]|uniref:hypothetical protein n=1 Tax=Photobacterium sp. (strain ATCC 43367) TaxID=379097 RepID=UPI0020451EDD|nr:hypothetical protein [Vibrio sinaloensis]UPQ90339.1 hypothetical protein MTO69_15255 [Vibrio sinaloensis]